MINQSPLLLKFHKRWGIAMAQVASSHFASFFIGH